jgi:RNA polymerase sigma factor (TIGR02999 family)
MADQDRLTHLIHRAREGDAAAADALFAAIYPELRRLARIRLRGGGHQTLLETSSLVSELYLRFAAAERVQIDDRVHFMRWASRAMRSVIVDYVRRRRADRRGGGAERVTLTTGAGAAGDGADEIVRVHEALKDLAAVEPRVAQVVEMRYFAGMTEAEIALALGVTDRTVRRDWEKARLLLRTALP